MKIHKGEFLYEKDNFYFIRNEEGQINKIPKNKFFDGQFIKAADGHHNKTQFVRLIDPTYTETRGWVYGNSYVDMNGGGGGCGYSFDETNFELLTDADAILFAERIYLNEQICKLSVELKVANDKLSKIEYCLNISVPNYKQVRTKCRKCHAPMNRNKTNCNVDECDNCYNNETTKP